VSFVDNTVDLPPENFFFTPEFGEKFQIECPYFQTYQNFLITECGMAFMKAFIPNTNSIRPVFLIQYRLVTDRRRHGRTQSHG